ncbi:hypothetical protein LPJ78_004968 [Coemansia sp. RSA 989]|nr:hypothetical protein BX667DRAFT_504073 [Coemansia mojavensis]KAJ1739460.1 hypothetical protein LPJ68_004669 [Coemansia sp. RSA 1086]KAJ1748454.1 hypothetical protein LPJ79_004514 [Coemansia sp. RSA 1821]KAJ1862044.1 hypothetical protein LPJ78_004968 [Coemansia sp. RSA 989]KAJ1869200.1 hypothetical protein LPJ55_005513 [Coemansia sp. RSA 990]KAJ2646436.1 hypothetical protein IWW40_005429 [Coemansia sp. RSA 1250]KAJ2668184.1 hypothetical protein IWW42_005386 [Coemansia sp. RSA 1085]
MVLTPIKRSVVPSPLADPAGFDEFATQYLNKCDDLLSYTQRYPTVKQTPWITLQRQNRNPHESHRWLRRTVAIPKTYDEIKSIMFRNRLDHLPRWVPHMLDAELVESLVPHMCDVVRLLYKSPGLKAKRDYCQLVIKREFIGEQARPKPRLFTPSASMANLAQAYRSQSFTNLSEMHQSPQPLSPQPLSPPPLLKHSESVRSVVDLHDTSRDPSPYGHCRSHSRNVPPAAAASAANQYVGLTSESLRDSSSQEPDRPVRRFQVVSVPIAHPNCTQQRGFVRAVYESYEEVCEYQDGRVEWVCIYHSDFSGWVPSFVADHSIASAFPKEAESLLNYINAGTGS